MSQRLGKMAKIPPGFVAPFATDHHSGRMFHAERAAPLRQMSRECLHVVSLKSMRHLQSQEAPWCQIHRHGILNRHNTSIVCDIGAWSPCTATVTADGVPSAKVRRTLHGIGNVRCGSVSCEVQWLLGICFLREASERANETDRRAGKWGLRGKRGRKKCFGAAANGASVRKIPSPRR